MNFYRMAELVVVMAASAAIGRSGSIELLLPMSMVILAFSDFDIRCSTRDQ